MTRGPGNVIGFDDGMVENLRTHSKEGVGRGNYNTITFELSGKKVKITTSKVCRVSDGIQEFTVFLCRVSYFCSWQFLLSSCSGQNS